MTPLVRSLLVFAVVAGVLAGPAAAEPRAVPAAAPTVDLAIAVKPARGGRDAATDAWVRWRLRGLVPAVIDGCYRPALASRPALGGTLTVRLRFDRRLAIAGVKADRDRFKLPSFAACVVRAVRDHQPLPPERPAPEPDPAIGAIHESPPPPPPPARRLPLTVTLTFRLAAPPAPAPAPGPGPGVGATPPPACGANPAGCKATGCPNGMTCDAHVRCVPSTCGCDPSTGHWTCTADCGGGVCVPARSGQQHSPPTTP